MAISTMAIAIDDMQESEIGLRWKLAPPAP